MLLLSLAALVVLTGMVGSAYLSETPTPFASETPVPCLDAPADAISIMVEPEEYASAGVMHVTICNTTAQTIAIPDFCTALTLETLTDADDDTWATTDPLCQPIRSTDEDPLAIDISPHDEFTIEIALTAPRTTDLMTTPQAQVGAAATPIVFDGSLADLPPPPPWNPQTPEREVPRGGGGRSPGAAVPTPSITPTTETEVAQPLELVYDLPSSGIYRFALVIEDTEQVIYSPLVYFSDEN